MRRELSDADVAEKSQTITRLTGARHGPPELAVVRKRSIRGTGVLVARYRRTRNISPVTTAAVANKAAECRTLLQRSSLSSIRRRSEITSPALPKAPGLAGTSSLLPKRHRNRRVVLLTSRKPDSFVGVKFFGGNREDKISGGCDSGDDRGLWLRSRSRPADAGAGLQVARSRGLQLDRLLCRRRWRLRLVEPEQLRDDRRGASHGVHHQWRQRVVRSGPGRLRLPVQHSVPQHAARGRRVWRL